MNFKLKKIDWKLKTFFKIFFMIILLTITIILFSSNSKKQAENFAKDYIDKVKPIQIITFVISWIINIGAVVLLAITAKPVVKLIMKKIKKEKIQKKEKEIFLQIICVAAASLIILFTLISILSPIVAVKGTKIGEIAYNWTSYGNIIEFFKGFSSYKIIAVKK